MIQTVVINESRESALQERLNDELKNLKNNEIIDIKIAGAYTGKYDSFVAIIVYKE